MATNSFVQVPPDGTGKKLYAQQHSVDAADVQIPVYHLGCGANPQHLQMIDARGQASVRFAEGSPSMDAFGNLRVGTATVLGAYEYTNDSMSDLFTDATANGGTIVWTQQASETNLSVGTTSGASASRTTNRYHYYQPGVGNMAILTLAMGDAGKVNNRRRWGYFDDNDGLFFELNGTALSVSIRSSTTGSVVERMVAQADWSADKLDGTGVSTMDLDVTKANFYFVDFAWLGVGEVRFGVLGPGGERNVCHIFQNPNSQTGAYMRTGSLPLRWENVNTGATGGTSDMRSICSAVYAESQVNYTFWRFADIERSTPVTVTTNTPVLSMRVQAGSRVNIYPECLCVYATGGNVKLTIIDDATLTGATWGITGDGAAEGDIGATAISGGSKFKTFYVPAGVMNLPLAEFYETNDEGYCRLADDSDSYVFTVVATKLDGTTVTVGATLEYRELR